MASTINAKNTSTGVVITPDASGQLELQTADTTRMTITSSGNVGIGTASPTRKLDVNGDINLVSTGVLAWGGSLNNYITGNSSSNYIAIQTNNAERMRIDSSGNVLVGTTSVSTAPATGFAFNPQTVGAYAAIGHTTSAGSGAYYISFGYNGGVIGTITQNGTTAVAYNTSSDYRLKENVQSMVGALETVAKLKPVTWSWKSDGSDGQGFIAHELQAVVPDCVTGEKDAVDADGNPVYQGIDTSFLVATLTAAIQELKAELDTVKAELATLKGTA